MNYSDVSIHSHWIKTCEGCGEPLLRRELSRDGVRELDKWESIEDPGEPGYCAVCAHFLSKDD